jgi:hypothetical protein
MNKIKYIAVALVAVAGLGFQQAKADTTSFFLGNGNSDISGFPGSYASVDVNRTDATHANITFTGLTNSGNAYRLGGQGAVGFNVNAASWTIGPIVLLNQGVGFTLGPLSNAHAGNEDGFGSFNQTFDEFDGFTHSFTSITVNLTNTSGTWSSASAVLTGNASGFTAAAHIFVTASPANAANGALATGFAANGAPPGVPDGGATVMLLGAALGGLGMARRFLKI